MRDNGLVLGLGNNIDYEFEWAGLDFQSRIDSFGIEFREIQSVPHVVRSERELVIAVLNRIYADGGGEFFLESPSLASEFAPGAPKKITMGGTGIRAAIALDRIGIASTAHFVTMNDDVRRLTPRGCRVIWAGTKENLYPHLIFQYPEGAAFRLADGRTVRSQRSNRVIMSNDQDNIDLPISGALGEALKSARVFQVAGFNVISDEAQLIDRVERLKKAILELPAAGIVFYEEAGFYRPEFRDRIFSILDGLVDIYSLNEDEFQELVSPEPDLNDPASVVGGLDALRKRFGVETIVLHTKDWGLVRGKNAGKYVEALSAGIRMAATRYAKGDDFTAADFAATADEMKSPEGLAFREKIDGLNLPELVCVPGYRIELEAGKATTIGLGDSFVGGFLSDL